MRQALEMVRGGGITSCTGGIGSLVSSHGSPSQRPVVNADLNCTLSPTKIAHAGGGQPRGQGLRPPAGSAGGDGGTGGWAGESPSAGGGLGAPASGSCCPGVYRCGSGGGAGR